jgi:hypothetical protein
MSYAIWTKNLVSNKDTLIKSVDTEEQAQMLCDSLSTPTLKYYYIEDKEE